MNFTCARCKKKKPGNGRRKYRKVRPDAIGRWTYSFQCADCITSHGLAGEAALPTGVSSSNKEESCPKLMVRISIPS